MKLNCLIAKSPNRSKAQIVVIMLIIAMIIGIVIPGLVFLTQHEAKWTVKEIKSTRAFHLAEAGIDRGIFKMNESSDLWNQVKTSPISNYANDTIYTDVEGGSYRINITTGDIDSERKIVATGKDTANKEYRTIEVVLSKSQVNAPLQAASINNSGSSAVFWGPMMSLADLDLSGSADVFYPRKMARGAILGNPIRDNDGVASTDGLEWWSYNHPDNPVPDPPDIPFEVLKTSAQTGFNYTDLNNDAAIIADLAGNQAAPIKNVYVKFVTKKSLIINNLKDNKDRIYYFDDQNPGWDISVKFAGTKHFRGTVIIVGDGEISGSGDSTDDYGKYTWTPPSNAWKEYLKNTPMKGDPDNGYGADSASVNEYPGDAGYHTVSAYNFVDGRVAGGADPKGGASGNPVSFKGYMYIHLNLSLTGSNVFHGAVQVTGSASDTGSTEIFYDDTVTVPGSSSDFTRESWKELPPQTGW
ncbi:MAG: hypothetical protein HY919_00920 [Elusimicrobia bacterium]|nr:hypothetical protein [Elusimicrobiota bacterium]